MQIDAHFSSKVVAYNDCLPETVLISSLIFVWFLGLLFSLPIERYFLEKENLWHKASQQRPA